MIILRIFLYLICIISIGWSILVFGGPPILKRLISGYSEGSLIATGVTVSPGLDIHISRLDFIFQNPQSELQIEGFARATKIEWSLFREKPFLKINLGPSVVKEYASADSLNIYLPSLQKIDWQNVGVLANIEGLVLQSFAKMHTLIIKGNVNLDYTKLSNLNIDAQKVSITDGASTYSANLITSRLSDFYLDKPIKEQLFSSTFLLEDIRASKFDVNAPEAIVELIFTEEARNFKIDLNDLKSSETGGVIKNLKVDGSWSQFNGLQELQIDFPYGLFLNDLPEFSEITAGIKKLDGKKYQAVIKGDLDEFELYNSDNLIGLLPEGSFLIDLEIDRASSKVSSISKLSFAISSSADIVGSVELGFTSKTLTKLECVLVDCELSDFDLAYEIKFDDEWVWGSANCAKSFCRFAEMDHLLRTSNTVNILTNLNQAKILNPLSSVYLYGAISSGREINGGHELKF